MKRQLYSGPILTVKVCELVAKKQFKKARAMLQAPLRQNLSLSKGEKISILSNLTMIEKITGNPLKALKILETRRSLGYRDWREELDITFEAATLFAQSEQWTAARRELIAILEAKRSLEWDSLLPALELYFDVERECYKSLGPTLKRACKAGLLSLGMFRLEVLETTNTEETVREAMAQYREASKKYQSFLLRAMDSGNRRPNATLINELIVYSNVEKVDLFAEQARSLLARIKSTYEAE